MKNKNQLKINLKCQDMYIVACWGRGGGGDKDMLAKTRLQKCVFRRN